jgi:FecR protein
MKSAFKGIANRVFVKLIESFSCVAVFALLLASHASAADDCVSGLESEAVVGKVSLVLGKAYLVTPGQRRQTVKAGTSIGVSDQIVTEANGHVHICFVDHALVSVRPDSQLEIISYDFNAVKPEQSSIKFNLIEGETRAISGEGAKAARSRFRLNTPIAAIGVRGTDFVVSATSQTTRALVNQGAIVLAPYSSECTAAALGPCSSNAVELTDSSLQIIEFEGTAVAPRLIPAPHEREPGSMREDVQLALAEPVVEETADDSTVGTDVYLENVTSIKATAQATAQAAIDFVDVTPELPVAAAQLASRQLVWGRYAREVAPNELITLNYFEASAGRNVSVGSPDYVLLRDERGGDVQRVDVGLGPVSFSLNSAQAFYNSDSGIVAMRVGGGNLDIDFNRNSFATDLDLDHISTGFIDFRASGIISENGYFNARTADQNIAGSTSLDGSEAGYLFEKRLEGGNITGLTLWDAK